MHREFCCVVVLALWCTAGALHAQQTPAATGAALPTDAIFAPSSFWYTPIPVDAPMHPNSAAYVADFLRQKQQFYGHVAINLVAYTSPVYVVEKGAATVAATQWFCQPRNQKRNPALERQWAAVPIPENAEPADGTDAEMTIYQPSTDTIWEFWKARKVDGQWQGCHGGKMESASRSDGRWHTFYGTTATGLPFLGGQITAEELQRGEIRHVMGISVVQAEAGVFYWPAKRGDGFNPNRIANLIPEGIRLRLDPGVNVDALKMHPVGKVIAKAAQKYGFVVWDKAGAITLRAQNSKTYTLAGLPDPYPALFNKTHRSRILDGFPWEKLQFLPVDYGKP